MPNNLIIIAGATIGDKCKAQIAELHKNDPTLSVVACDSGILVAHQLGIIPSALIGDLDSTPSDILTWVKEHPKIKINQFQSDKDETDLELTLRLSNLSEYKFVSLFGCLGGREDFALTNIHLIANHTRKNPNTQFIIKSESGRFIFPHPGISNELTMQIGQAFSVIPITETVEAISLFGAKWGLDNDPLSFGSCRGISNIATSKKIELKFSKGLLAVFIFE